MALSSVSPAAREEAIAELTKRFTHDQLTMDEFERRAAAVYAATTPAALMALTADLRQPIAHALPSFTTPMHVGAMLSSVVRQGSIAIPDRVRIRSIAGNVELDLTNAEFVPGVTEIHLNAFMGNIEIQLPPHVGIEDHVSTMLGSFEYRRQPRATNWTAGSANSSVVRFTGRVIMSSVEVTVRAGADDIYDDDE
jgi:hypothetical protein